MIYERDGRMVAMLMESQDEHLPLLKTIKRNGNRRDELLDPEHGTGWTGIENWLGAPTFAEFERRLHEGWGEGVDKLRAIPVGETPTPQSVRRRRVKGDHGDAVDMQAVYRGSLDKAWQRCVRQNRSGPRQVTIVCNLSCNAHIEASTLFWRGASALRVAEALTEAGYAVAIIGACAGAGMDKNKTLDVFQAIEIKAIDAPLDMSALAALVCMPGFKRRQMHSLRPWACDREDVICSGGLGYDEGGAKSDAMMRKGMSMLPLPQDAFIQPHVDNAEEAAAWVASVVAAMDAPQALAA